MVIQGIIFGLFAATCQSLCYVFSRIFVTKAGNRSGVLFGLSHTIMGIFAVALLPFCYSPRVFNVTAYALPLLGTVGFYMLGQVCLFHAVKCTDASRVAPLLGLKILVLSLISVLVLHDVITPLQWLAVFLCLLAALVLNHSGGAIPFQGIVSVLGACIGYSLSDLSIVALVRALSSEGSFGGIMLGCSLSYVLAGLIGFALVASFVPENRTKGKWKEALPVAVTWFLAMICLYVCFSLLGAVFGNIVQSTRGPISVLMGMAIAAYGQVHLERHLSLWVLIRRIGAALIMCVAIGLFAHERSKANATDTGPQSESTLVSHIADHS